MEPIFTLLIFLFAIYVIYKFVQKYKSTTDTQSTAISSLPTTGTAKFDLIFDESDKTEGKYLVVDIETTGLPINRNAQPEDFENWPHIVQIAWFLFDDKGKVIENNSYFVKSQVVIPQEAIARHGITNKIIEEKGEEPNIVYAKLADTIRRTSFIVSHNTDFDLPIIECEFLRNGFQKQLLNRGAICTMKVGKNFCRLKSYSGGYKYPTLMELFKKCFFSDDISISLREVINPDGSVSNIHRADVDVEIASKCFFRLKELNKITDSFEEKLLKKIKKNQIV